MELNNYLQATAGGIQRLEWHDSQDPLLNAPWTTNAYIDGKCCGTGTSDSRAGAREMAAQQALSVLDPDHIASIVDRYGLQVEGAGSRQLEHEDMRAAASQDSVAETNVLPRKNSKVVKNSRNDDVWPPHLKDALQEALQKHEPDS